MASLPSRTIFGLPIESFSSQIGDSIASGSLVLTAEPGAGKTSVVPIIAAEVLDHPRSRVVVLQPRRLAARAAAQRLASVWGESRVGGLVGLTMRGERNVSSRTRIEVITEAVLTNRLQRDPELTGAGVVVFDEFHERNLHSDLGLAMAVEARDALRPDLGLVVMSATLDPQPVADMLGPGVPIISVPGRTYGVETIHVGARPTKANWVGRVADITVQALAAVGGDVLVFVPGRWEIDQVIARLAPVVDGVELVGLHGGSPSSVRIKVMDGSGPRRVVVATSVAETSLTLPRIEAVVDAGLARRPRFDSRSGIGSLSTGHVTKFGADQRRGRAGRLQAGVCFRLWSRDEHRHLDDSVAPEIVAGDPLVAAYELSRWGDPDGLNLQLLDHPGAARLSHGRKILAELGLIDLDSGALTEVGSRVASLGIHPRLAALVVAGGRYGQLRLALRLAAMIDSADQMGHVDIRVALDRSHSQVRQQADKLMTRWNQSGLASQLNQVRPLVGEIDIGWLMAASWPDRIARRLGGDDGRYLMANGRECRLSRRDMGSSLGGAAFLIIAQAGGLATHLTIQSAVPVERSTVLAAVGDRIKHEDTVEWDGHSSQVVAERRQVLGGIVMHREQLTKVPPHQVSAALIDGVRANGLKVLTWSSSAAALRSRLAWLHGQDPAKWPDVGEQALISKLDDWLDAGRCVSPSDISKLDIARGLIRLLGWSQHGELDRLAPPSLELPNGRSRLIDYASGQPTVRVRIQQLFGLDKHPVVGPLQTPIVLELLSPADRVAQRTTDLPGFWRGSYGAVRSELRGRYPKHDWPEDPVR